MSTRRGDVFFSLHTAGEHEKPVYISEVVEKSMNPDFQHFDLTGSPASGLSCVTLKVWCDFGGGGDGVDRRWSFLIEEELELEKLTFLARSMENCWYSLPPNCIVWHLTDGCYTMFWDAVTKEKTIGLPREKDQEKDLPTITVNMNLPVTFLMIY
jgi:hypothetical protein